MLGFNKWFVIFLVLSLAVWYGTGNRMMALQIIIGFIFVRVVWKFLVERD